MKEVLGLGSDSSRSTLWLYTHGVKLGIVMGRLKEPVGRSISSLGIESGIAHIATIELLPFLIVLRQDVKRLNCKPLPEYQPAALKDRRKGGFFIFFIFFFYRPRKVGGWESGSEDRNSYDHEPMGRAAVKRLLWKCDTLVALLTPGLTKEKRPKDSGHKGPNSPASPTGTPGNAQTTIRNKHIPGQRWSARRCGTERFNVSRKLARSEKREALGRMAGRHRWSVCLPAILP